MTADELAAAVGAAAAHELDSALERIKHCLGQLSDEQVWRRDERQLYFPPDDNQISRPAVTRLPGNDN